VVSGDTLYDQHVNLPVVVTVTVVVEVISNDWIVIHYGTQYYNWRNSPVVVTVDAVADKRDRHLLSYITLLPSKLTRSCCCR
jgi:hypothetical protein